jgi:hypothetical protein
MEVYGRMELGDGNVTEGAMDAMVLHNAHELHNDGGHDAIDSVAKCP